MNNVAERTTTCYTKTCTLLSSSNPKVILYLLTLQWNQSVADAAELTTTQTIPKVCTSLPLLLNLTSPKAVLSSFTQHWNLSVADAADLTTADNIKSLYLSVFTPKSGEPQSRSFSFTQQLGCWYFEPSQPQTILSEPEHE